MAHLLYHPLDQSIEHSPFDRAALSAARDSEALIVSPYIGISYLERILDVAEDWRLISDVEAWLSSLSVVARPRAWEFIRNNLDRIHHCAAIHAKVVIGQRLAMIGSANLTSMGVLGRTEMGILLDEPRLVSELTTWFEELWGQTASPIVDEANALVVWLDEEASRSPARRQRVALTSQSQRVRAKLIKDVPISPLARSPKHTGMPAQGGTWAVPVPVVLDLGVVAGELIRNDETHVRGLAESVQAAIDQLANQGFSLREVMALMAGASVREVYFLVLQHCANHPRSVFVEATINRLVLQEHGRFVQSSAELLPAALMPYDDYLRWIICQLDFAEPRLLASEEEGELITGLAAQSQVLLVSGLLDCGLLNLIDMPGSSALYMLGQDFDWSGRFRFFPLAAETWKRQLTLYETTTIEPINDEDLEDEDAVDAPDAEVRHWSTVDEALTTIEKARQEAEEQQSRDLDRLYSVMIPWLHENPGRVFANKPKHLPTLIAAHCTLRKAQIETVLFTSRGPKCWTLQAVPGMPEKSLRLNPYLTVEALHQFPKAQTALKEVLKVA